MIVRSKHGFCLDDNGELLSCCIFEPKAIQKKTEGTLFVIALTLIQHNFLIL